VGVEHGILVVARERLKVCELPDGTLTLDDELIAAERQRVDRRIAEEQKHAERERAERWIAEEQERAERGRARPQHQNKELSRALARAASATPARVERLRECLEQGLLSQEIALDLTKTGRITDSGWESISKLSPKTTRAGNAAEPPLKPPLTKPLKYENIVCWTAELQTTTGVSRLDFNPLRNKDRRFPSAAVAHALNELSDDGWRVIHVSEDRGVDQDASVNFVTATRFFLAR
jgi:hypothetical protein